MKNTRVHEGLVHTIVLGLNFKSADVEVREKVHFSESIVHEALTRLHSLPVIEECVILSTCNRVELYASTPEPEKGLNQILHFVADFHNIDPSFLEPYIYQKNCEDAVSHLFKVASSLDSMVVGENQILGQVKDAYESARKAQTTSTLMNRLFQGAIQVGKKVRTETTINKGEVSIGSAAIDLVREIYPPDSAFRVMILGAGEIADVTLRNLAKYGRAEVSISNRSKENALKLAEQYGGSILNFEERYHDVLKHDIVIVSTGASEYILKYNEMHQIMQQNKTHNSDPVLVIDLSVPRNADPALSELNKFLVYSINDLNRVVETNKNKREKAGEEAGELINESMDEFTLWYARQKLFPVVNRVKKHYQAIKKNTMKSYSQKLRDLDDDSKQLIEEMLEKYIEKLIKEPLKNTSNLSGPDEVDHVSGMLKKIYNLQD